MGRYALPLLLAALLTSGCNDTSDLAPASFDTPWNPPPADRSVAADTEANAVQDQAAATKTISPRSTGPGDIKRFDLPTDPDMPQPEKPVDVDCGHACSLVELIDIAQRQNKETRIAWEQARQAAFAVGIARSDYLPQLTASALGGYQHIAAPFPSNLVRKGYITANGEGVFPEIGIKYLLLDFGGREAKETAAEQLSFASNVLFTAAHQKLILDVTRAYFAYGEATAETLSAQETLAKSREVQKSAEAMYKRGTGTIVSVQLATGNTAQADYTLVESVTAQHSAMYALLNAMGLPPTTRLLIEDATNRPLPASSVATAEDLMQRALRQRPDIIADLARLRALQADIDLARSEFLPKISVSADVKQNIGQLSVDGGRYQGINEPEAGLFLRFEMPLFDGGLRENRLRTARSKRAEAEDKLQQTTEEALRQVAIAYDQLESGFKEYQAAVALQTAANVAYTGAKVAFTRGVGNITDIFNAEGTLSTSGTSVAKAHAEVLTDAAALAFATGDLTSSLSSPLAGGLP